MDYENNNFKELSMLGRCLKRLMYYIINVAAMITLLYALLWINGFGRLDCW